MTHDGQNRKMRGKNRQYWEGGSASSYAGQRGALRRCLLGYLRRSALCSLIKPALLAATPTLDRYSLMTWMK